MKYSVETTNRFEKALKKCIKKGLRMDKFKTVVDILSSTGSLPPQYRPHKLSGEYAGIWECHIESDWLLLWEQNDTSLTLLLVDTGRHSDIF
jgi:mRNA interferase YafQ